MKSLPLCIGLGLIVALAGRNAAAQAPDGRALFRENCRACHGTAGVPPQRMLSLYKNLRAFDSTFLTTRSEDSLVAVLQHGVGRDMKPFKDKLTTDQMRAIAMYVKTFAHPAPKAP